MSIKRTISDLYELIFAFLFTDSNITTYFLINPPAVTCGLSSSVLNDGLIFVPLTENVDLILVSLINNGQILVTFTGNDGLILAALTINHGLIFAALTINDYLIFNSIINI